MDKAIKANFAGKTKTPAQKQMLSKMLNIDKKLDASVDKSKKKGK
jgi:hypothetical protein